VGRIDRFALSLARPLPLSLALRLGELEGRALQRAGRRGPSTGEVADLFGLAPAEASGVAAALSGSSTRTRNLWAKTRDCPGPARGLVEVVVDGDGPVGSGPAVFVGAPWGPHPGSVSVLVERADMRFILNLAPSRAQRWGVVLLRPGQAPGASAVALKAAVDHLGDGGAVALALRAAPPRSGVECSFFGRRLMVARGAAALARRSGAPLVPVTCSWVPGRRPLEVRFHRPLLAAAGIGNLQLADTEVMQRLLAVFEATVRSTPERGDRRLVALAAPARR